MDSDKAPAQPMIVDDDNGEHCKTVYAHFGAAIYFAQCLEHGLVLAMVYVDLIPNRAPSIRREDWGAAVDSFMDTNFRHTLGQLIRALGKVTIVPPKLESRLSIALDLRNWLAHAYFRERATEWISPQGRERMIDELQRAEHAFREADQLLDSVMEPMRLKYGYTDERLQKASDEMMEKARLAHGP